MMRYLLLLRRLLVTALILLVAGAAPIFGAVAVRTWTSADGRTIEAEVVSLERDEVTLRRASDGRTFTIPLDQLSAEDRAAAIELGDAVRPASEPSRNPAADARTYVRSVAHLNDEHAKAPGPTTEDDLKRKLPPPAREALGKLLGSPSDAAGVSDALKACAAAALDLDRTADHAAIRAKLAEADPAAASALPGLVSRARFLVIGDPKLSDAYLTGFADVTDAILSAYDEVFGFDEFSKVPGKKLRLRVRVVDAITRPPHFAPQFPWHSEIDFPVLASDEFTSPTGLGQFLFYGLCHELGHVIAMWGDTGTMEDHHAWAHYTGVTIVEHLSNDPEHADLVKNLRDVRWRSLAAERDEVRKNGTSASLASYEGVMALLIATHDAADPKAIGAAINRLDADDRETRINHVRYYQMTDFADALAESSNDPEASAAVEEIWKGL